MASHVSQGYNPEVSLLQGGTAPIVPVQGGGGMEAGASLPAGYNPEQSLLNTGASAPIVAIRGGGQQGGKDGETAYHEYSLEIYDPPLTSIALPALKNKEGRQSLFKAYQSLSKPFLKELKSFLSDPTDYVSSGNDNPLYKICPTKGGRRRLPIDFFQGIRKRVVIIENENPHIWILPNLQANTSKFLQYMKLIPKGPRGNIDPNHYVVLTGSLFSPIESDTEKNLLFYEQFLELKIANIQNLFYLNHLTESFVTQSCTILNTTYSTDYLSKEEKNLVLPTFLEPDFLLLKKQRIILKNSELPFQRNDMTVSIGSVLEKADPDGKYKSFFIVPLVGANEELNSNSSDAPPDKKFFLLDFNPATKKLVFPADSTLVCPKGQTCSNFKGGYLLEKISDDKRIEISNLYHIYKNIDKMPFFKNPGSMLAPEELASLTGTPKKVEEAKVPDKDKVLEEAKAPEEAEVTEAISEEKKIPEALKSLIETKPIEFKTPKKDTPFEASPNAVEAKEQEIEVNAKTFLIRIPLEKGVRNDWIAGKYSENEVKFFQALQLTPQILSDTFGGQAWKVRLADFLESILLSKCFEDTTLLTKLECSNAQLFVKKVYITMYNRLLSELYDEMGMIKPKSLGDLLFRLNQLEKIGPKIGKFSISKFDYTGDLLERFQTIHFNKETGLYSADFAELTDATRDMLQKMKLYRVNDADIAEITKAILEKMKIPISPSSVPTSPPKSPSPNSYTIEEIKSFDPIPSDFFTSLYVEPDGLCFPRAVLKAVMATPVADTEDKKVTPLVYVPDEAQSLQFVREIRDYLRNNKDKVKVKNVGATGIIEVPVEQYFDAKYKAKTGEAIDGSVASGDRIRVGTVYKKLSFDEYLNMLDESNKLLRPFAEVNDAGIGTAAAKLKNKIILIYQKKSTGYTLLASFNEELGTTAQPLSTYIFLEWVGGNHYNLLQIKPGKTIPHVTRGGFIEEELIAEGVIDLGEVLEENIENALENTPNKKKYRKKTARNKHNKRNASRKHSHKRK
jgi:hypothetical protein